MTFKFLSLSTFCESLFLASCMQSNRFCLKCWSGAKVGLLCSLVSRHLFPCHSRTPIQRARLLSPPICKVYDRRFGGVGSRWSACIQDLYAPPCFRVWLNAQTAEYRRVRYRQRRRPKELFRGFVEIAGSSRFLGERYGRHI